MRRGPARPRDGAAGRAAAVLVIAIAVAAGTPARAQSPDTTGIFDAIRVLDRSNRFALQPAPPEPPLARGAVPSLAPAQLAALRNALALRETGMLEEAKRTLDPLVEALPHHPAVLKERAAQLNARGDFASAERLARAERQSQKDSLLLAPALVQALERQAHGRDAAGVAIEAWVSSSSAAPWARWTLERLLAIDPRGIREAMKRVSARAPERTDLAMGAATLMWRAGDPGGAVAWLAAHDTHAGMAPMRWVFAGERLRGPAPDSAAAALAMASIAGDKRYDPAQRTEAARRALDLAGARGAQQARAIAAAIADVPQSAWGPELTLGLSRALREGGDVGGAKRVLAGSGDPAFATPPVALERATDMLREGPPERAVPELARIAAQSAEAGFRFAEALLFAGMPDSALGRYQAIADDPSGAFAGAALERVYLIEDGTPKASLPAYGRMAWEAWRGESKRALALAESLYAALPHGTLWAQTAIDLSAMRERAGDDRGALAPVLALADSLPDDRLASLARQRAGDLYLDKLKDEKNALVQYESCLARYPRAWNAAEVRRRVEALRHDRRF